MGVAVAVPVGQQQAVYAQQAPQQAVYAQQPMYDPNTGQPMNMQPKFDPATGQPLQSYGQPVYAQQAQPVYAQQGGQQAMYAQAQPVRGVVMPQGGTAVISEQHIIGWEMTGEAWCWVVILIFVCWPLFWIPCVMDSCKRPIYDQSVVAVQGGGGGGGPRGYTVTQQRRGYNA